MSILDHLNPAHRSNPEDHLPDFKTRCCMKYTVDKQCRRCPFRQIKDENQRQELMNQCREKRRGETSWQDPDQDLDIIIEYNNQYL